MKCDYCGKEHNKGTVHPMHDVALCNKCTAVVKPVMKVLFVNKKTGDVENLGVAALLWERE